MTKASRCACQIQSSSIFDTLWIIELDQDKNYLNNFEVYYAESNASFLSNYRLCSLEHIEHALVDHIIYHIIVYKCSLISLQFFSFQSNMRTAFPGLGEASFNFPGLGEVSFNFSPLMNFSSHFDLIFR
jgi:hypothetical protein